MINKFYNPFKPHIVVNDEGKYYIRRLEFSWSCFWYGYKYCKQSEYQGIHYPNIFNYCIDFYNYAYDDLMDAQRALNVIKSLNRPQPKPKPKKRKFKKI